jgi:hypothetical protein
VTFASYCREQEMGSTKLLRTKKSKAGTQKNHENSKLTGTVNVCHIIIPTPN